ncbi:MarR family winged helix-turn-helix transcriptional regulator [Streptomyces sp. NPDC013157]|uniref:MarR family winged helix-turn-helix transcriptional regulator n=1 Tax=unclassified Streptomyces TaxID=2593676 RepID=UPI002E817A9B|nr:MarR family transcriptional regulator [Streptomyces sp. NBC_00582]WUB67519.1 MarR family transcriptional regulator [Streptomyces sp. NBC_00582]
MSESVTRESSVQLVRVIWTLHRVLYQRQSTPGGESRRRPLAHVEVLRLVESRPGIGVREAAVALGMQPNNVSTIVTQLVRDGFLERRTSTHDKRYVELHPTDKMRTMGGEVDDSLHNAITEALGQLPPETSRRITASLPDLWELARTLTPASR